MIAAEPDRWMRPLHGLERDRATLEAEDLAAIVDGRLRPQRLDELDRLAEPPHAALARHPEVAVVVGTPQADAEDRAAPADDVERGHLVRDVDRMAHR